MNLILLSITRVYMPYRFLDHSSDALVEVRHTDMRGALTDAALSTIDIMLDRDAIQNKTVRHFDIKDDAVHRLLYQWLDDIIFVTLADNFAIKEITVDEFDDSDHIIMKARAFGEPLDLSKHRFRVEVKAPTYHEMKINCDKNGIVLQFLLDL